MSEKTKSKKVVKIVIDVILSIFLVFSLCTTIMAITSTSSGDGIPSIGGYGLMTVESDSMDPTIKTGDMIFVKLISDSEKDNIKKGDIITFVDEEKSAANKVVFFNTHTVYQVVKNKDGHLEYCITWGDNRKTCPIPDETQRMYADIRGIYTGVRIAGFGSVVKFLTTPTGFFVCILLPLFLIFIYELINVVRTALKLKNKDKKVISAEDEELIRKQAIEEYLKQQANSDSSQVSDGENEQ